MMQENEGKTTKIFFLKEGRRMAVAQQAQKLAECPGYLPSSSMSKRAHKMDPVELEELFVLCNSDAKHAGLKKGEALSFLDEMRRK